MPGDTKEIKFSATLDAKQIGTALSDVIRMVEAMTQQVGSRIGSLVNMGVNTGGPIIPGAKSQAGNSQSVVNNALAKTVEENKKVLDSLAGASKETMKVMSDHAGQQIDREKTAITSLSSKIQELTGHYKELKDAMAMGGQASGVTIDYESQMRDTVKDMNDALHAQSEKRKNLKVLEDIKKKGEDDDLSSGGGKKPPFDLFTSDIFGDGNSTGGKRARTGLRSAGLLVGGVTAIAEEYTAENFDYVNRAARQAQAFKTMGLATSQGDVRYLLAMDQIQKDPELKRETMNIGDSNISYAIKEGVGGMVQGILGLNPNFVGQGLRGAFNIDSKQKEDLAAMINKVIASDPEKMQHAQEFAAQSGQRVAEMRMTGSSPNELNRMLDRGGDMGFGEGEVMGTFGQLQSMAGRDTAKRLYGGVLAASRSGMDRGSLSSLAVGAAMMDDGGHAGAGSLHALHTLRTGQQESLRIKPRWLTSNLTMGLPQQESPQRVPTAWGDPTWGDSNGEDFRRLKISPPTAAVRLKISPPTAAVPSIADQVKTAYEQIGKMSPATLQKSSGGGADDLVSRLNSRGDMALNARNFISQYAGSSAADGFGFHDLEGLVSTLSTGVDKSARGGVIAKQNAGGLEAGARIARGDTDPFQMGMNYLNAQRNAGPNASIYTVRALARDIDKTTMASAFAGTLNDNNLPAGLAASGVTTEMIQAQIKGVMNTTMSRVVQENGANSPMARAIRALGKDSGSLKDNALGFMAEFDSEVTSTDAWKHASTADRKKMKARQHEIGLSAVGNILKQQDASMSTMDGASLAREMMYGIKGKIKRGQGGGDAASGSNELDELKTQLDYAKNMRTVFGEIGDAMKILHDIAPQAIQLISKSISRMGDLDKTSGEVAGRVTEGFKDLAESSVALKGTFDSMSGHSSSSSRTADFLKDLAGKTDTSTAKSKGQK